jgi:hypothetical protein
MNLLAPAIDCPEARKGFNMNNPEQAAGAARGYSYLDAFGVICYPIIHFGGNRTVYDECGDN